MNEYSVFRNDNFQIYLILQTMLSNTLSLISYFFLFYLEILPTDKASVHVDPVVGNLEYLCNKSISLVEEAAKKSSSLNGRAIKA